MEYMNNIPIAEKIARLEETCNLHSGRLDLAEQEIKMILTEVNIIINWIQKYFDVEILKKYATYNNARNGNVDVFSSPTFSENKIQEKLSGHNTQCTTEPDQLVLQEGENVCEAKSEKVSCQRSKTHVMKRIHHMTSPANINKEVKRGMPKESTDSEVKSEMKGKCPVQCTECGKVLKGPGSLRAHMQTHSNLRPHKCPQCAKAFRMKHHLEFHLLVHSGDKKESCCFCGKTFLAKRDLLRHERTHTGEKPFACQYCPKSFNVKQHLTLHIRTHTGERPYKCAICEKTFSQANSLRIHKKIHLKEKIDERNLVESKNRAVKSAATEGGNSDKS